MRAFRSLTGWDIGKPAFLTMTLAILVSVAQAQSADSATDPRELLTLAAKLNNLAGAEIRPWHLKASFKVLYKQGNVTDEGTYEEFWASSTRYKRNFSSKALNQTEYGTEQIPMRTGDPAAAPYPLGKLRNLIVTPLPTAQVVDRLGADFGNWEIDGAMRECPELKGARFGDVAMAPDAFCLDSSNGLIASISGPGGQSRTAFTNPAEFQGRKIARDVELTEGEKVTLSIHIETLELLAPVDDAMLQPPADARPAQIRMVGVKGERPTRIPASPNGPMISAGVAQGLLLTKVAPVYPPVARAARVSGTVVLQATISKEGKIVDLQAVSGPPLLLQAAMDAVQQWTYRPYMLNEEPVEVLTTVNVVFQLGTEQPAPPQPPE